MKKNLDLTNGIFFSQRILLELTTVGFTREESYKLVQKNAMQAWKENSSFYHKLYLIKKSLVKYLLINLKNYLILVIIQKKLI